MYFRVTLFNSVTLFVLLLTIGMIYARFHVRPEATWPLLYYAGISTYGLLFRDSLNPYWVMGGIACGVLLRFEFLGGWVMNGLRVLETIFFAYMLWQCASLLLLWPW